MIRNIVLFCLSITLVACGSAPSKTTVKTQQVTPIQAADTRLKDSHFYLQQAGIATTIDNQQSFYILAVKSAIAEKKSVLFLEAILNKIDIERFNSVTLDIELAKALLFVEHTDQAAQVIERLSQGSVARRFEIPLRVLNTQLLSAQDKHLEAIRSAFQLQSLYQNQLRLTDQNILNHLIWRHILKVPNQTLNRFMNDFGQHSNAWIALANIINESITDPVALPVQLARWQRMYPLSIEQKLPEQVQRLLSIEPYNPQTIGLLLPLSGKLSKQAQTIRDGFLASKPFNSLTTVHVIDTGILTLEEVEQALINKQVDFIVGPLEKETVISFQKSTIINLIPRLSLNIPELIPSTLPNTPKGFYFSLSPEDEIDQAIEFFIANEVNSPAVIYADNTLGRRLYERFNSAWSAATDKQAEAIAFKSRSKLGDAVQKLLEVDASQARIRNERLFGNTLETETRSRTDIDAVYVIANSQQTRLIKPFFDVYISAFGKRLPIYASSRSFVVDESREQKRDLNGLAFTEMPWLIKNTEPQLHALYAKIGERQTQLKKLFAFGHDAYQLIFALKQLEVLPTESFKGLTGNLSVNDNLTIKRQLSWSRYNQGKVIAIKDANN